VSAPYFASMSLASTDPAGAYPPEVRAILDQLPGLAGQPREVESLTGGLTNRNYRVVTNGGREVVVRISAEQSALLQIDRDAEHRNAVAAAEAGVGPAVAGYLPGQSVLAVEWIDGRTFTSADLDDSANLARVAATCRRLHAAPRFANDFDMFTVQRGYLDLVLDRRFRLPRDYVEFMPKVDQIRSALTVRHEGYVPCHNDLLAANMVDDGERIWFIDYEYAGNNDAYFELGNIWSEASLSLERLDELVAAYHGRPSRALVARARLLGLMAKYGWTLWASIQNGTSAVDFDFWAWGMEKYDRALAEFRGPDFATLLADVQQAS
jgi:thiamine kinase-like enzyme